MLDPNLKHSNILAFAEHMESLDPALYDQTRDVHDDGSPSCLLAHLIAFFEPETWAGTTHPRSPRFMREAAERILGLEYSVTAFLYWGVHSGSKPKPRRPEKPLRC